VNEINPKLDNWLALEKAKKTRTVLFVTIFILVVVGSILSNKITIKNKMVRGEVLQFVPRPHGMSDTPTTHYIRVKMESGKIELVSYPLRITPTIGATVIISKGKNIWGDYSHDFVGYE
jgi:hypothetical protein